VENPHPSIVLARTDVRGQKTPSVFNSCAGSRPHGSSGHSHLPAPGRPLPVAPLGPAAARYATPARGRDDPRSALAGLHPLRRSAGSRLSDSIDLDVPAPEKFQSRPTAARGRSPPRPRRARFALTLAPNFGPPEIDRLALDVQPFITRPAPRPEACSHVLPYRPGVPSPPRLRARVRRPRALPRASPFCTEARNGVASPGTLTDRCAPGLPQAPARTRATATRSGRRNYTPEREGRTASNEPALERGPRMASFT
jgi:hypothetical protein